MFVFSVRNRKYDQGMTYNSALISLITLRNGFGQCQLEIYLVRSLVFFGMNTVTKAALYVNISCKGETKVNESCST